MAERVVMIYEQGAGFDFPLPPDHEAEVTPDGLVRLEAVGHGGLYALERIEDTSDGARRIYLGPLQQGWWNERRLVSRRPIPSQPNRRRKRTSSPDRHRNGRFECGPTSALPGQGQGGVAHCGIRHEGLIKAQSLLECLLGDRQNSA
jgi:hypothetical protein